MDPEQKSEIVHKHIWLGTLAKEYSADKSMLCRWVKEFISSGEGAFLPKMYSGNHFSALHTGYTGSNLSEIEQLRLTIAKLEVENK